MPDGRPTPSGQPVPRWLSLKSDEVRARLTPRSVVAMEDCEDGWCEVRVRRMRGFVRQRDVFGGQDRALCNAARPAGRGR